MTDVLARSWHDANQRCLVEAVKSLRTVLETSGEGGKPSNDERDSPGPDNGDGSAMEAPPALEHVCAVFGLSPFERDVLLMCAGVELDARFAATVAAAQRGARTTSPTFGLALAAFPGAHWSALTPDAPLRRWRLIDVGAGETLASSPIRIDERVLHHLAGVPHLDERLRGLLELVAPSVDLLASQRMQVEEIVRAWSSHPGVPVIELIGDDHSHMRSLAAAACARVGLGLYAVDAQRLPHQPAELDALVRLAQRESVLGPCGILIDCTDALEAGRESAIVHVLEHLHTVAMVSSRTKRVGRRRTVISLEVGDPESSEQEAIWRDALGEVASVLNGRLDTLCSQFDLSASAIRAAAADALHRAGDGGALEDALWEACRAQARPRLDDLAQRILPCAGWDDLVLPDGQKQVLSEIAIHVRHRAKVYETWGFSAKGSRGLGISALFTGPSGTGKTMAGEVLGLELKLDLYRIDLSQVVSKYIGETEKNLRRVFDAAEKGCSILLFDEADALFGKRSDVKDSHDRYANVEISYLLQRMEAYRGLAILTTNMKQALDPAFMRRIRFVVHFPFPDVEQRVEIWRRVFPAETPVDNLDFSRLARLQLAGGSIRNIAMNAAFLAAERGQPVRMRDLLEATRGEYAKLERPLSEAEVAGWR